MAETKVGSGGGGRRDFLKTVGGVVAGLIIGAAVGATTFPSRETVTTTTTATQTTTVKETVTHTVTQTVAQPAAPPFEVPTVRDSDFTWKEAGKTNIVVIGAGPAGATFVKTLAAMPGARDKVTITVIEQNEVWISGVSHSEFIIGSRKVEEVMGKVKGVVTDPKVVRLVQARVTSIDPANRVVYTNLGKTSYDILVLAPGIVLGEWEIEGLSAVRNHHAWDPGHALALGAAIRRLESGNIVFGVPPAPYKCPPAPYEITLLTADWLKELGRSGRVKITLVDANANPQPPPKARIFKEWLDKVGVEYVPNNRVVRVDAENKVVETDKGEKFKFDLLSVLPRNFAPGFVREAGLARQYTEVDLATFRTKAFDDVYAVGDHILAPYTKSAYAANTQGQRLAEVIAERLGLGVRPTTKVFNICWSYVNRNELTEIVVQWEPDGKTSEGYPKVGEPIAANKQKRHGWEEGLLRSLYA
jgi:NADPH-dependent 2,4-dienoyl-CoA reductase/sulfur reductase-like enzyme